MKKIGDDMYNGLINVYKEPGFTSFDVVAKLRGILKQKKIGHTGTLDPDAEGVLPVCLGDGTKLVELLEDRSKEYICEMLLGTTTDTEDTSGLVLETNEVTCTETEIIDAINSFLGDYAQIPPMYSALKVNGKKLYELAREGKVIERKPRNIHIYKIEINKIKLPYVTFTVECSKGTYIRSLCRDIGEKLQVGGTMNHLTRKRVGHFNIENALTLKQIEDLRDSNNLNSHIISLEEIFKDTPAIYVNEDSAKYIDNGNPLTRDNVNWNGPLPADQSRFKVYNSNKIFVATYTFNSEKDLFMPEKIFPSLKTLN